MADYKWIFHILLRWCFITESVHLICGTLCRTISSVWHNLNVGALHSCFGRFVLCGFMIRTTSTQGISCLLFVVIKTFIKSILRWSTVISLCLGSLAARIKRFVNQIAQNIRLLRHIYWFPFFGNSRGWLLLTIDTERGHCIVHIARHDGLRSSLLISRCSFVAPWFWLVNRLKHLLRLQCLQDRVRRHHWTRLRSICDP